MPRTVSEARLQERSARARLQPRHHPYWRAISEGRHIGYYNGKRGGSWVARCRVPDGKEYLTKSLGEADDNFPADGLAVLNWAQALELALEWFEDVRIGGKAGVRYTVGDALDDYLENFTGKSLKKTRHTIEKHIRPALGERRVCELTTSDLRKFQTELATRRSVYRANRNGVAKPRPDDGDADRRGKANANRIFAPLKAALNRAFNDGKVPDDTAWRRVKPFPKVSVARIRYFAKPEIEKLLRAAEPWFRSVLQAALFTGARWSEIHRMKVRDVDLESGTVHIPETKSGRPRYIHLTDDGLRFFARQCAGKALLETLFLNQHGRPLGPSHQIRPMAETCAKAGIEPAGFHILRHTYGSTLAMAGVPLAVIAEALGHADERITRKHYAHLSPSYVRDAVRKALERWAHSRRVPSDWCNTRLPSWRPGSFPGNLPDEPLGVGAEHSAARFGKDGSLETSSSCGQLPPTLPCIARTGRQRRGAALGRVRNDLVEPAARQAVSRSGCFRQ